MTAFHTQHRLILRRAVLLGSVLLTMLAVVTRVVSVSAQEAQVISASLGSPGSPISWNRSSKAGDPLPGAASDDVVPSGTQPDKQVGVRGPSDLVAQADHNCSISDSVQCFVDQRNMEDGDGSWANPFFKFPTAYEAATDLADQHGISAQVIISPGHYLATGVYDQPVLVTAHSGPVVLEGIQELRGNTACAPGERDCNVCVNDVVGSFQNLPNHYEVMGFDLGSHPPPLFNLDIDDCPEFPWWTEYHGHWQGIQRLSGADGRYLVATRDKIRLFTGIDYAGFAVVRLDGSQTVGRGPFISNREIGGPPTVGDSVDRTVRRPGEHTHPGGIQTMGDILVVGTDSEVLFYDLSDPATLQPEEPPLGALPDPGSDYGTSAVALAQLETGRYLLVVLNGGAKSLDFYISDEPDTMAEHSQSYVKFSRVDRYYGWDSCALTPTWDNYQGINLVTDCASGQLYLVATGNRDWDSTCWWNCTEDKPCCPDGTNRADLYEVYFIDEDDIWISRVAEADFLVDAVDPENGCNFDAAAGVYTDDSHRLYLYCTEHADHDESYVRFLQFGPVP
jgi:hypothetical protein